MIFKLALRVVLCASALAIPSHRISFAQANPSLTLSPTSGPCDATITVTLTGFAPNETVRLDIARPFSDDVLAPPLEPATTDANGSFSGQRSLGEAGCQSAAIDAGIPASNRRKVIDIWAGVDLERRALPAHAAYSYTTSSVSPATGTPPTASAATAQAVAPTPAAGGSGGSGSNRWVLVIAASAGGLALLGMVFLLVRRERSRRK